MNDIPTRLVKVDDFKGVVCVCYHCGERFGSSNGTCANLCKNCRTAEQRKGMDVENITINPNFKCRYCTAMK